MLKPALPYCLAALFAAAFAALAAKNKSLRAERDGALAELAALKAAPPKPTTKAERPRPAPPPRPAPESAPAPKIGGPEFEKAVEERVAARTEALRKEWQAKREAEREERRRQWENETDEQREERRREFQARMREHSAKRLAAFVENVGLDEEECVAFEGELNTLDAKVREIAEDFAAAIGEGVPFNFETQMQLFNEMSSAVLDAYAGLDETMPDGWREKDSEFNVWLGIGPDAADPLFDALRKVGIRAPFMGPPPR